MNEYKLTRLENYYKPNCIALLKIYRDIKFDSGKLFSRTLIR